MFNIPPFCSTTTSRRRRHSPMHTARNTLRAAVWEHPVRWARHVAANSGLSACCSIVLTLWTYDSGWLRRVGCPAADGLPPSKFCLSWRTQMSSCIGMGETQPVVPGQVHRRIASSSWCRGAAEWRTYWTCVPIIFKHWFHDEIRPGITICDCDFVWILFRY